MNKPTYKADVERLVNPHAAEAHQKRSRKIGRMLLTIIAMLIGALVGMVLWLLNVNGIAFTIIAIETMFCVAAFVAGRLWEIALR